MWLPEEDKYTNRKAELLARPRRQHGGRVAEELALAMSPMAPAAISRWRPPPPAGWYANGHERKIGNGRVRRPREDTFSSDATSHAHAITAKPPPRRSIAKCGRSSMKHTREPSKISPPIATNWTSLPKRCLNSRPSTGRKSKRSSSMAACSTRHRDRPRAAAKDGAEKPPKQVVVAPDVTPPLPGALGGAPRNCSFPSFGVRVTFGVRRSIPASARS